MKFLFLISRFLDGGIDTVLVEYLNALCSYTNHEVTLAIGTKMNEAEVFLPRISDKVKITYLVDQNFLTAHKRAKHHHQKNKLRGTFDELFLNPVRRIQMHRRLKALSKDADVVIDFDACFGSFMSDVPKTTPKLVWFHFSLEQEAKRVPKRIKRLKQKFAQYNKVVLIADAMVEEAIKLAPEYADKYCRIYNCLDPEKIHRSSAAEVTDERIQQPYFLSIERLEESQKDLTTLIKAYALLPVSAPHLYIIGEGRSRNELEALILRLQLQERVHLLGFQSNPYPWMKNAISLVHSSKFEGLPTVLIEALIMDKIIISSDCPTGPREILANGKAGILTPVGDTEKMTSAMQQVLTGDEYTNQLLEYAKSQKQNFLPQTAINQLLKLIKD